MIRAVYGYTLFRGHWLSTVSLDTAARGHSVFRGHWPSTVSLDTRSVRVHRAERGLFMQMTILLPASFSCINHHCTVDRTWMRGFLNYRNTILLMPALTDTPGGGTVPGKPVSH